MSSTNQRPCFRSALRHQQAHGLGFRHSQQQALQGYPGITLGAALRDAVDARGFGDETIPARRIRVAPGLAD